MMLPLAFCRECGQEYYVVRKTKERQGGGEQFLPRELNEIRDPDGGEAGFLYISSDNPWPDDSNEYLGRLPDDWTEDNEGELRVKKSQRRNLPEVIHVRTDGKKSEAGQRAAFFKAPFRTHFRSVRSTLPQGRLRAAEIVSIG